MTGPAPAVARVRNAVRGELQDLAPGATVLAAVSGGRDSLALAAALAFEAPKLALRAGAVIVDHGIQPTSLHTAQDVSQTLIQLDLDPVEIVRVDVDASRNIEANARRARYEAISKFAASLNASAVLLGHTIDDQAETVLLGLARGSGAKSLAGMATRRGVYRRPLLGIDRLTTGQACAALGLQVWDDPHNDDPDYTRVRVRRDVLPVLERELGPGVAAALARTAAELRDDDAALEQWAAKMLADVDGGSSEGNSIACEVLDELPPAVRRRMIRQMALSAGVTQGALRRSQIIDVEALVTNWHGQGDVALPGGVAAGRAYGRLAFKPGGSPGDAGVPEAAVSEAREQE